MGGKKLTENPEEADQGPEEEEDKEEKNDPPSRTTRHNAMKALALLTMALSKVPEMKKAARINRTRDVGAGAVVVP